MTKFRAYVLLDDLANIKDQDVMRYTILTYLDELDVTGNINVTPNQDKNYDPDLKGLTMYFSNTVRCLCSKQHLTLAKMIDAMCRGNGVTNIRYSSCPENPHPNFTVCCSVYQT